MHSESDALKALDILQSRIMRECLLQTGKRLDGRALHELRPVSCEAGILPRSVHGSALFNRGDTQSLATTTVGPDRDTTQACVA